MIVLILSYVEIFIKGGEKILRPRHAYFRYCSRVAQTATDVEIFIKGGGEILRS